MISIIHLKPALSKAMPYDVGSGRLPQRSKLLKCRGRHFSRGGNGETREVGPRGAASCTVHGNSTTVHCNISTSKELRTIRLHLTVTSLTRVHLFFNPTFAPFSMTATSHSRADQVFQSAYFSIPACVFMPHFHAHLWKQDSPKCT